MSLTRRVREGIFLLELIKMKVSWGFILILEAQNEGMLSRVLKEIKQGSWKIVPLETVARRLRKNYFKD